MTTREQLHFDGVNLKTLSRTVNARPASSPASLSFSPAPKSPCVGLIFLVLGSAYEEGAKIPPQTKSGTLETCRVRAKSALGVCCISRRRRLKRRLEAGGRAQTPSRWVESRRRLAVRRGGARPEPPLAQPLRR